MCLMTTDQNFPSPGQFEEDWESVCPCHGVSVCEADRLTLARFQLALLGLNGEQFVVHHLHLYNQNKDSI